MHTRPDRQSLYQSNLCTSFFIIMPKAATYKRIFKKPVEIFPLYPINDTGPKRPGTYFCSGIQGKPPKHTLGYSIKRRSIQRSCPKFLSGTAGRENILMPAMPELYYYYHYAKPAQFIKPADQTQPGNEEGRQICAVLHCTAAASAPQSPFT